MPMNRREFFFRGVGVATVSAMVPRFAVAGARVGKLVELEVDAPDEAEARSQLERMCEQLLANPLIESFEIEVPQE